MPFVACHAFATFLVWKLELFPACSHLRIKPFLVNVHFIFLGVVDVIESPLLSLGSVLLLLPPGAHFQPANDPPAGLRRYGGA